MRRTKVCTKCGDAKDLEEFGQDRKLAGGLHIYCRPCDRSDSDITNPRTNGISRIAGQIARSKGIRLYSIPKDERLAIRTKATVLYENGVDYSAHRAPKKKVPYGFVYVITNPAWPDHVKIGKAEDADSRFSSYGMYCPFNDFKLYGSVYFENRHTAEREILARLKPLRETGEWFKITPFLAKHELNKLRSIL